MLEQDEDKHRLTEVLKTLTPIEEKIINMRFGLGDEDCDHTLRECAEKLNVSPERIRQRESKALRKLRHPSRANLLRDN
jgi:RNA polymerase primary sigma factor